MNGAIRCHALYQPHAATQALLTAPLTAFSRQNFPEHWKRLTGKPDIPAYIPGQQMSRSVWRCAGFSGAVEPAENLEKRMIPVVRTKSGAEVTATSRRSVAKAEIQTLRGFRVPAPGTTTVCSRDSRDSDPVVQHAQ
jgi:hypothetical protein